MSDGPRYIIKATIGGEHKQIGSAETSDDALDMIKAALQGGATYACQHDQRPLEPMPTTDAEKEALANLVTSVTKTVTE